MNEYLTVIVPAAGVGKRLGLGKNKAFACIGGMPLLILCMKMLAETGIVCKAIVVVGAAEIAETEAMLENTSQNIFLQCHGRLLPEEKKGRILLPTAWPWLQKKKALWQYMTAPGLLREKMYFFEPLPGQRNAERPLLQYLLKIRSR